MDFNLPSTAWSNLRTNEEQKKKSNNNDSNKGMMMVMNDNDDEGRLCGRRRSEGITKVEPTRNVLNMIALVGCSY